MMAERAKVIVHMFVTIDGKTTEYLQGSKDARFGGAIYDQFTLSLGEAWGCGRATFDSHLQVDLSKFSGKPHDRKDRFKESDKPLCFAIDRYGKLRYKRPTMHYGPIDCQVIEALTDQVDDATLHHYDEIGVGYIFAGKEEFDMDLFLEKLYAHGIKTFVLCGGANINQEFLKRDLVDEISLIMVPGVSGTRNGITSFGSLDPGLPKLFQLIEAKDIGHNCVRLRYKR
ncbi:MAG: dihydrofolate reductase family protein [Bacilli bacterium]|nr:dihydrofolate reductase family protein [Bacilli bacterium]